MEEYKGIIDKLVKSSYYQVLVIDVVDDKIYKYKYNDNEFVLDKELSYMDYLSKCSEFIYEDDLLNYVESLSLTKLDNEEKKLSIDYKMLDDIGNYSLFNDSIMVYDDNGKKMIVVLTVKINDKRRDNALISNKNNIDVKYKKMVDLVGLSILKIHNIMISDSGINFKREYIDSILSNMTNEFPEFNEAINSNAIDLYDRGKSTIMIVDDDKMTCSLIKKIFDKDYDIIIANNGKEAIDYLSSDENSSLKCNISCIFLDLLMPVLDGFSVLDYLNDNNYLTKMPVIIISGNYDKDTRNRAYSYQIADMLEKPFNVQVIRHRIENLINLYRSSNSLNNMMLEQHKELKNIVNSLVISYEMDNDICMKMIKRYTRILTMQVSVDYPEYNINSNMIDKIANSAVYFAIGNYTVPKSILYKKGIYTEEERSIIKMANINGGSIIKYVLSKNNNLIDPKCCYEIAKYYNERYDGNGYPEGLSGNSIPLSVQIASIAIEYSNLINTINPVDYDRVAALIIMESGRKFNPKIVESFKKVKDEFRNMTKVGD